MEMDYMDNLTSLEHSSNRCAPVTTWDLDAHGFNQYLRPVVIFYEMLVFLVSFTWNLYIIIFLVRNKKMLKKPPDVFFLNLAIAYFAVTVICIPIFIATVISGHWPLGSTDCSRRSSCKAIGFMLTFGLLVTVYFLAAVAFDRLINIVYNWQYKRIMSVQRAWIIVAFCWVVAALCSSPPLYGFGMFFFEDRLGACLFRWSENRDFVIFFAFQLLIPIIVIIVCTIGTYRKIRHFLNIQHQRTIRHMERQSTVVFRERHRAKQRNVFWIFAALLFVLTLCWAPGIVTAMVGLAIGYDNIPSPVFIVALLFVLSNIMLNPIIHSLFRQSIRKSIIKFVCSVAKSVMCCSRRGKTDYSDNVASFLRESRGDHQPVSNNSGSSGNSSNMASDEPTLVSYVPTKGSTDNLVDGNESNSSGASKPTGIKRKVSIIELQEMEERRERIAEKEEKQRQASEVVAEVEVETGLTSDNSDDQAETSTVTSDNVPVGGTSGTFMEIL